MENFFNIDDMKDGIFRQLADGLSTHLFPGDQAMISVVRFEPNATGILHHHEEEQWGLMVEGSGIRIQGEEEIVVKKGDFWRTPSNVSHTMKAGPEGAVIFDVFAPPRSAYLKAGEGFGD